MRRLDYCFEGTWNLKTVLELELAHIYPELESPVHVLHVDAVLGEDLRHEGSLRAATAGYWQLPE